MYFWPKLRPPWFLRQLWTRAVGYGKQAGQRLPEKGWPLVKQNGDFKNHNGDLSSPKWS